MNIPQQYLPVMPYLIVHDASAFFKFTQSVFDAKEQLIVPADDKITHGELKIQDAVIMFADASDTWQAKTAAMYIYVNDVNNVYNLAMNNGAKSLTRPEQKDFGYTAGIEDPFGNQWFIVEPEKN